MGMNAYMAMCEISEDYEVEQSGESIKFISKYEPDRFITLIEVEDNNVIIDPINSSLGLWKFHVLVKFLSKQLEIVEDN